MVCSSCPVLCITVVYTTDTQLSSRVYWTFVLHCTYLLRCKSLWHGGAVGRTLDLQFIGCRFGSWFGTIAQRPWQATYTYVPLSPGSMIWYQWKMGSKPPLKLRLYSIIDMCVSLLLLLLFIEWLHCVLVAQLGHSGWLHNEHSAADGESETYHWKLKPLEPRGQRTWTSTIYYFACQILCRDLAVISLCVILWLVTWF